MRSYLFLPTTNKRTGFAVFDKNNHRIKNKQKNKH